MKFNKLFFIALTLITIGANGQKINPLLVGNNAWWNPLGQTEWNLTKECGVQLIRIGGADYDKNMPEASTLLGWVKSIEGIGAVPLIQVSQYKSAANAASYVRYFNKQKNDNKAPIKYWCIGNEPILQANWPASSTFAAKVAAYFKPIADSMKAVDSTIIIYGPDECDYNDGYYNDLFGGKNDITDKVPGHTYYYCDGLSWHRYPQGSGDPATEGANDMIARVKKAKAKVDFVNTLHNRTGENALQWGIGEYNSKNGAVVHTWGNGQMFGIVLGACMKYEATYAATWSIFESGGSRQGNDFSFLDGNKTPRASYRHMQFVAKYFKGNYADGKSSNTNIVTYGAKNGDTVSVMIMNTSYGAPLEYTVNLNKDSAAKSGISLNIDAGSTKNYNDIITGRSTHVLLFKGNDLIKITYTSSDFDKGLAPSSTSILKSTKAPRKPTQVKTTLITYKSIAFKWKPTLDTLTGIFIERKKSTETAFTFLGFVGPKDTSFVDGSLTFETEYQYRIKTYNTAGKSEYSDTLIAVTLQIPPHAPYSSTPLTIPGKIEAENYDNNDEGISYHDAEPANQGNSYRTTQGVDIQPCTDVNGGFNVCYIANTEWLDYSIANITAGTYDIAVRVSSYNTTVTNKRVKVYLGGQYLGYVTPIYTSSWQTYTTLYINDVVLTGGSNQILKLSFEGSEFNVNWVEFGENLNPHVNIDKKYNPNHFAYNAINKTISLELSQISKNVQLKVIDINGRTCSLINKKNFTSGTFNIESKLKGVYFVTVLTDDNSYSQKIVIE
jgi:hypothetical protein